MEKKTDLEKIILFLAGACDCHYNRNSNVLTNDFTGPIGTDGKRLSSCSGVDADPRPYCSGGNSWHVWNYGVTLKNSALADGYHSAEEELGSMSHGTDCPESSADVGGNVDSMWLYLGTADAAPMPTPTTA